MIWEIRKSALVDYYPLICYSSFYVRMTQANLDKFFSKEDDTNQKRGKTPFLLAR